jgi:hypothetical protein
MFYTEHGEDGLAHGPLNEMQHTLTISDINHPLSFVGPKLVFAQIGCSTTKNTKQENLNSILLQ